MKNFFKRLLSKWVIKITHKHTSRPDKARIHKALTELYNKTASGDKEKGLLIPFRPHEHKFIIFSDQHKGAKNGSDDFAVAEKNYLDALEYYNQNNFHFISLGDAEELWENTVSEVKKYNGASFEKEKLFLKRNAFTKVFGNHDLDWGNSPLASLELQSMYEQKVPVYEGVILTTNGSRPLKIFLTHGHQGDLLSDGNWLSKWFVSKIWAPFQAYLRVNPNTPAFHN